MTREEAKAYIIRRCNPDYPKGKTEWEQAMNMAIKALEQPEPKWIPCSEKLPEEGCEVLCCDWCGQSIIGLPYVDEEAYTGFSAQSELEYIFNCVAWMPLPEAYREEGEER